MIANALLITIAVMLAIGFALMGELKFFIPFKVVIWRAYSTYILAFFGILFTKIFAAAFVLNRKFFLKDTGRKKEFAVQNKGRCKNVGEQDSDKGKNECR